MKIMAQATQGVLAGTLLEEEFYLNIDYTFSYTPPYFQDDLEEQDTWVGDSWELFLPEPIHDNDLEVSIEVEFDKDASFILFDEKQK